MAKIVLQEVKDYAVLPEDTIISVIVDDCQPREVPARNGREGWTKCEFKFRIDDIPSALLNDGDYRDLLGERIFGSVSFSFTEHPDNKLRQWSEALLNMGDLGVGFELDTDMLIGRSARAVVSHYKKRDGTLAHQVGALLPPAPLVSPPPAFAAAVQHQPVAAVAAPVADVWGDEPPF